MGGWRRRAVVTAVAALLLSACATPAQRLLDRAQSLALASRIQAGAPFEHLVLTSANWRTGDRLHVYIEHDGRPFETPRRIARDPTPAQPVALDLMGLDPAPALYLGRPCYFGAESSPACGADYWTNKRYSSEVVSSMQHALEALLAQRPPCDVILIGHSGGGTLAVLLAERMAQVAGVVTLAGNLDVGQWSRLHGYSALEGSLDPLTRAPLRPTLRQLHVAGARDENVPPVLVQSFASRQPGARMLVLPEEGHLCCWARHWPALLAGLPPAVQ